MKKIKSTTNDEQIILELIKSEINMIDHGHRGEWIKLKNLNKLYENINNQITLK